MSASRKKMLRREENRAAMTERQEKELKEAKKLKLYTALFTAAIVLMIVVVLATSINNAMQRNATALTVGEEKVTATELNYFYIDAVNSWLNSYGSYAALFGLDTTKPLNEQYYDEANEQTWADYFLESATTNAQAVYAMYQDAQANGYVMDQETLDSSIESTLANYELYAALYGYDLEGYLQAIYGSGTTEKSYREYLTIQQTVNTYYSDTYYALTYTDEDLRAAEAENFGEYSSFDYDYYYLAASKFYEGGTTDEEGTTTYSDEEKAAGAEKAKEAADSLLTATSLDELNEAIAALEINAESTTASATSVTDRLYSSVDSILRDWVASADRKAGDMTVIESATTTVADHEHTEDEDESAHQEIKTVSGYYVVLWNGADSNQFPLVNVRHILLSHEGGTTDDSGNTTYSDEEKAATKAKAEELLASFTGTEDDFAALANEHSTDTGSNTTGGLYEDIYPGQMVTNFNDWCFDESRQPGDTGIVESEYGYHIMYFVGDSETTYRDYMITNELRSADISEWETSVIEAAELTVVDTSRVNLALTLSSDSSEEDHDHE